MSTRNVNVSRPWSLDGVALEDGAVRAVEPEAQRSASATALSPSYQEWKTRSPASSGVGLGVGLDGHELGRLVDGGLVGKSLMPEQPSRVRSPLTSRGSRRLQGLVGTTSRSRASRSSLCRVAVENP
ncbi:MAG: hypothetical protein R3F60_10115 [bacterium]